MCLATSEKKRNTPESRKGNNSVDDSGNDGLLAAADPCYKVESEKTDAAPIECAHDSKYEGESVKYHSFNPFGDIGQFLPDIIFP